MLNMYGADSIFGYVIARSLMNTSAFTELSYHVLERRYHPKRPGNQNHPFNSSLALSLEYARPLGGADGIEFQPRR